jgi:hypothetical protein
MAKRNYFADIDLNQNEMQFAVLHSLGTAPSSGTEVAGQLYYDTGSNTPFFWNGSTWTSMSSATASTVPWSGVQSGTNTNQTLTVGSNTVFIIGDGTLEFQGSGAGTMTLGTSLTGAVDRTINLPNVSATSTVLAANDIPAANQFVVATGSTEGLVEYRTIQGSDITGLIDLGDLGDVTDSGAVNPAYLRWNGAAWVNVAAATVAADVDSLIDHGALAGLSDDDHSQYIINVPSSSVRNVIVPGAFDVISLTVRGAPQSIGSATYDYFIIEDQSGNDLFKIGQVSGNKQIDIANVSDFNVDTDVTLFAGHSVTFVGGGGNVSIDVPGSGITTWSLTLPVNDGSSGQFLQTDGSGNTSWQTVSVATSLDDLTDVVLTLPANPSYLRYSGSNWIDVDSNTVASDIQSAIDHGSISGLGDDDHAQYVINAPTLTSRNLVTAANAGTTPLTLRGASSQTADLFVVEVNGGQDYLVVTSAGNTIARGSIQGHGSAGTADSTGFVLDNAGIGGGPRTFTFPNNSGEILTSSATQSVSGPKTFGNEDLRFIGSNLTHGWAFTSGKSSGGVDLLNVPNVATNANLLVTTDASVTAGEIAVASSTTVGDVTFRDLLFADLPAIALDDLSDVSAAGPTDPAYLRFSGSTWQDATPAQIVSDIESSIDHGSIAGLGDDDHTQYIINAPANSTRNVIDGGANARTALSIEYDISANPGSYRPWFEILGNSGLSDTLFSVGIGTSSYEVYITDATLQVGGNSTFSGLSTFNSVVTARARVDLENNASVRLYDDDDSNYAAFDVPSNITSNYTMTLPDEGPPGNNYILSADSSGNFSWIDGSGVSVSDHGSLSGLADDDHAQYIIDAPNIGRTNVITPTDNTTPLVLRAPTGASARFGITDNAGANELLLISSTNDIQFAGDQIFFNHPDGTLGGYVLITRSSTGDGGYINLSSSGAGNGGYIIANTNGAQDAGFLAMNSNGSSRGGNIDLAAAIGTSSERAGQWTGTAGASGRGGDLVMDGSQEDAGDIDISGGSAGSPGGSILTYGGFASSGSPDLSGGHIHTYGANGTSGVRRGGNIETHGGPGGRGGDLLMVGSSSSGSAGDINTSGGVAGSGGSIFLQGGTAGSGGTINLTGSTTGDGGDIDLSAGTLVSGGSIDMSGGTVAGGSLTTSNGGGSIDTNAGTIQLGVAATRVTMQRSATAPRTVTFIDQTGSVPVFASAPGSSDLFVLSDNTTGGIKFATRGINNLSDVDTSGLSTNDLLQYNGSNWVPIDPVTVGVTDHGSLTGLTDDDHAQYIIDDPSNNTRNIIASSTNDTTSLTITASGNSGSASFDIFRIEDSANTELFSLSDDSGNFNAIFTADMNAVGFFCDLAITESNITLVNAASQSIVISMPASGVSNYSLVLPVNDGSSGQFLQTNGSGVTSWATALTSVSLNDLTDVVLTSPANPSYLRYNGSNWIDAAASQILTDIESSIDHGSIAGLSDDDHGQYIHNAPTGTRNIIQAANSTTIPLSVRANATQAVDVFVVESSGGTNYLTIANSGNATFSQDVTITGDLTVNGTTTTINTTELVVEDNIIVVNSLGTVQNAGLEVERGASANASVYFDETANEWYVDNASVALQLARKYVDSSTVVGNGVLTTFAVTHNMGTSDVIVALYDSSDNQVEVEVVITNSNTVTFNFNDAVPNLTAYKAVIVG